MPTLTPDASSACTRIEIATLAASELAQKNERIQRIREILKMVDGILQRLDERDR